MENKRIFTKEHREKLRLAKLGKPSNFKYHQHSNKAKKLISLGNKKGKLARRYIDGRSLKKYFCKECGCRINRCTGVYGAGRCRRCSGIFHSGKNHYCYKDGTGYGKYPKEFNKKLKYKIRNRDDFRCVKCGMTEEKHLKKYNKVLEVHHKDHNRENCKESNLETRCKKCNLNGNKGEKNDIAYIKSK